MICRMIDSKLRVCIWQTYLQFHMCVWPSLPAFMENNYINCLLEKKVQNK